MPNTYVVIANERDYANGVSTLRDIIYKDELPRPGPKDRGMWIAQGLANVMARHVFCYSEGEGWRRTGPVFPIDDGEFAYHNVEGQEDFPNEEYSAFVERMQKEGRWQGDRNHPKYPWKGA